MSNQGRRDSNEAIDATVSFINSAMVRLLVGNDWFGDGQLRQTILDEFNHAVRTLRRQGWVVMDKPFNVLLERLRPEEPMSVAIRYEMKRMRELFDANFRPIPTPRRASGEAGERVGPESSQRA